MYTVNEHSVCEEVLYRGESKQKVQYTYRAIRNIDGHGRSSKEKWEHRNISIKRNDRNGKYVVEVQRIQRKILWRVKKPETVELMPNSYAVIHMDILDSHRNVIALVHLSQSSHITGQFFTSEHTQVVSNLGAVLSKCCDVISFDVEVDGQGPADSLTRKTQLLIFHDRICITTNQGYDFRLLGEWPIDSVTQLMTSPSGVTLVMTKAGGEETLTLRTEQGNDIKSKLTDKVRCLSPAGFQGLPYGFISTVEVTQCDSNSNIVPATRKQSKSYELMPGLHIEPSGLKSPHTKGNPELCQRQLSSQSCVAHSSKESGELRLTPIDIQHSSDWSLSASTGKSNVHIPQHDNEVNAQKLLELHADKTFAPEGGLKGDRENVENDHETLPPPIPQRRLKSSSEQTKQSNLDYFTIPRSRSFQIVEQPLHDRKKQRHKSESSVVRKTITELVQPICIESPSENSENSCDMVVDLKPLNNACSLRHTECSLSENEDASQKSTNKKQASDTIHYVNLPEGSRPSCYLYMNLPDPREAPREAPSYVNHVFMGRSMKGIYENVFCNKSVCSEGTESVPSPPPPVLLPRQPPPRIPKRLATDRQGSLPARLPITGPLPPPRPPKKHLVCTSVAKEDIQVQIAVFASRAVASRVWYLRIVVMRHDPDDTTFKRVTEREIASKYHLLQTHPFSISSDIVISLKKQCQQFKLTSEHSQEVDYNIIENLVHGFWFVIEFHVEHLGCEVDQFVGDVCVEPKDFPVGGKCPINKKFNLGITEDFELKQHCSKCKQLGSHNIEENQPCKLVIAEYALRKKVCEKLDITTYSRYNWRDVAGQLKFSVDEIKKIEDMAHRCLKFSPMDYVLTTWEQKDPGCSLERLVSILRDIERLDVVWDLGYSVDSESS